MKLQVGCARLIAVLLASLAPATALADEGTVCFFRPSGMGGAIVIGVREGEAKFLDLRARSYRCVNATAGTHAYWAKTESRTDVNVDVVAGSTVYVVGTIRMGFAVGHPHLELSTKAEFDEVQGKLKVAEVP